MTNNPRLSQILILLICCFFLFGLAGQSNAQKPNSYISALDVQGNVYVNSQIILKSVSSKVGDLLEETAINSDLKAIYSLGYFEDVKATFVNYRKGIKVVFVVKENPVVRNIYFTGNTSYSTSEMRSLLSIKENQLLSFKLLRNDINTIQEKFKTDGYVMSRITDVITDPASNSLIFKITEGYVQGITIEGTTNTKDYVIYRELKTKAGSVFNENTLKSDIRRIFNLGYFSEINPVFQPGKEKNQIIIILKITEARTSTINFGGGYGEREGWFGFIDLAINNLKGTAQNLLAKGQWGQEISTYQFKYYNPWFMPERLGERTSLTARFWNTLGRDIYLTLQDEFHVGWDLAFGKELYENVRATYSLGYEAVSPRGDATFEAYNSKFIGTSLSYDTRDVWMNPSEGAFHTISVKQGWKDTTSIGTTSYTKYGLDLNRFYPLRENTVFAWHTGFGFGVGDVPLGELYWAGGPNTVRGYSLNELKKGTRRMISNVEIRYTFNSIFQGVAFFDWGNAWDVGPPDFSQFIAGYGPGIRINTPLGPIRLDYGIGTNKNFGQGILHFSIGQAF